jgi:DNA (cytosine-5)-methyltransferase 1
MNIFDFDKPKYKLPPKPKLFEAFAGIGCQRLAFDKLGLDYEMVGISEIDKSAIASYNAIHGDTKNYGDIKTIKGSDLSTIDIFTYSFPCQDLSRAGKAKGLTNRSGLVYEVLRIFYELKELNNLPKVLIMENVADLIGKKFVKGFAEIREELFGLGYNNYVFKLNAKDFNIPQNRDRVFMVSLLGDNQYNIPSIKPLTNKITDYLETTPDEPLYDLPNTNIKYYATYLSWLDKKDRINTQDHRAFLIDKVVGTIPAMERGIPRIINNDMKIRKLTPRECWRLMGIDDKHYDKVKDLIKRTQLYKQAGNGIVVDVFAEIIKEMI